MTTSTNEWNRLGLAVFILIVGFALLAWSSDMSVVTILGVALMIFGAYLLLSSLFKNKKVDQMGTSESGSAIWLGSITVAVGLAIFLYDISEDWKISVAALLFAIAIYLIFTVGMKKM